jgi:hypothetical protein
MSHRTGYTPPIADFRTDLDFSFDPAARAAFDTAYRTAFGAGVRIETVDDRVLQRQGIDVRLRLSEAASVPGSPSFPPVFPSGAVSGAVLGVDEKIRRRPLVKPRPWNDLLIEEFSDWDRQIPGWLGRDKRHDLIAYGGPNPNRDGSWQVLLFWSHALRQTAAQNWRRWLEQYGRKFAQNAHGYRTSSIPVPLGEIAACQVISLGVQSPAECLPDSR